MEYIRSNNLKTAFTAFTEALTISNKDPLVYNEVGVVFYKQKHYEEARKHFQIGLDLCKEDRSLVYQNIAINLAHSYRKLK
jgi:anaphase-promoting complex subunit 6